MSTVEATAPTTEVPVTNVAETKAEEVAPATAAAPAVEAEAPKAETAAAADATAAPAATEEAQKPAEEAKEAAATSTPKKEKRQSTFNKLLAAFQSRTKSFNKKDEKKEAVKTEETPATTTEEAKPAATEVSIQFFSFPDLVSFILMILYQRWPCKDDSYFLNEKKHTLHIFARRKKLIFWRACHNNTH